MLTLYAVVTFETKPELAEEIGSNVITSDNRGMWLLKPSRIYHAR